MASGIFLYSTLTKLAFCFFFLVFFKACHFLDNEPKTSQSNKHNGVQINASSNCRGQDCVACHNVARQIFSLKVMVQLFVAVTVLVVVGIKIFQHLNRVLRKGCVDAVKIENVLSSGSHWCYIEMQKFFSEFSQCSVFNRQ